jgi:hypothetical protein
MALFRRGRKVEPEPANSGPDADEQSGDRPVDQPQPRHAALAFDRSRGPWDAAELDLADPDLPRIDLGSLQVPGIPGLSLQVEADQETQAVVAVTAVKDDGGVQIQAYAAPKSEGLWDDIRAEITEELAAGQGKFTEGEGAFGPEIRAALPVTAPDGRQGVQQVRFIGIDGPRWFLRGVFLGRAAVDPDPQDELHHLLREIVVVRGPDAMAPRTPLPLRLPTSEQPNPAQDGLDDDVDVEVGADDDARYADLNPFERGPEITEIR